MSQFTQRVSKVFKSARVAGASLAFAVPVAVTNIDGAQAESPFRCSTTRLPSVTEFIDGVKCPPKKRAPSAVERRDRIYENLDNLGDRILDAFEDAPYIVEETRRSVIRNYIKGEIEAGRVRSRGGLYTIPLLEGMVLRLFSEDACNPNLYEKMGEHKKGDAAQRQAVVSCISTIRKELLDYYADIIKPTLEMVAGDRPGKDGLYYDFGRRPGNTAWKIMRELDQGMEIYGREGSVRTITAQTQALISQIRKIDGRLPAYTQVTQEQFAQADALHFSTITAAFGCRVTLQYPGRYSDANVARCELVQNTIRVILDENSGTGKRGKLGGETTIDFAGSSKHDAYAHDVPMPVKRPVEAVRIPPVRNRDNSPYIKGAGNPAYDKFMAPFLK